MRDDASVVAAAANVAEHEGRIDVLINNAGVHDAAGDPGDLTAADALAVSDVNLIDVIRTTTAFLPLLRRSDDPAIVNVSSGVGSLALIHDPDRPESHVVAPLYTSSKAALTMLTTQYAEGLKGIRVNAAGPGYTATDLNGHSGPQTVTEGTDAIVALAPRGPAPEPGASSPATARWPGPEPVRAGSAVQGDHEGVAVLGWVRGADRTVTDARASPLRQRPDRSVFLCDTSTGGGP